MGGGGGRNQRGSVAAGGRGGGEGIGGLAATGPRWRRDRQRLYAPPGGRCGRNGSERGGGGARGRHRGGRRRRRRWRQRRRWRLRRRRGRRRPPGGGSRGTPPPRGWTAPPPPDPPPSRTFGRSAARLRCPPAVCQWVCASAFAPGPGHHVGDSSCILPSGGGRGPTEGGGQWVHRHRRRRSPANGEGALGRGGEGQTNDAAPI